MYTFVFYRRNLFTFGHAALAFFLWGQRVLCFGKAQSCLVLFPFPCVLCGGLGLML